MCLLAIGIDEISRDSGLQTDLHKGRVSFEVAACVGNPTKDDVENAGWRINELGGLYSGREDALSKIGRTAHQVIGISA